jgi:hypothetical protein
MLCNKKNKIKWLYNNDWNQTEYIHFDDHLKLMYQIYIIKSKRIFLFYLI